MTRLDSFAKGSTTMLYTINEHLKQGSDEMTRGPHDVPHR
jgi:hypothetical protein